MPGVLHGRRRQMPAVELFVIAVIAFAVSSVSGGGAGLLLMPLLGATLSTSQVPAALSVGSTISSMSRIVLFTRSIQWRIVRWFVPAAIPAAWLGAWLLSHVNPLYLEMALALFLLANLPLLIRPNKGSASEQRMPLYMLSVIGAAAGFVSGLTGAVGLLFNRFYLHYGLVKESVIATRAANEIILHALKIALYASFGLLTPRAMAYGLLIGVAALVATWLTKRALPHISETCFKRAGYGAMVLAGVVMLGNATTGIARQNDIRMQSALHGSAFHGSLQWREATFSLEFKFAEGFEIEKVIDIDELPAERKALAMTLIEGADDVVVEKVYTISRLYYEIYAYRNGELSKHDI
jgi:uncharacterized membrane protein YfcA